MVISGKTEVFAVIGDPIEHTLSPAMHNAAFEHLGLDYVFLAFKVTPDEVEKALQGVRALGIRGLNVTMPNKQAVTEFIDEADATVKFLRSANTILNQRGRLRGFNTDGIGAAKALKDSGIDMAGRKVLLLGAGGAAKAIAFTLVKDVNEVCILNRSGMKARELANMLEPFGKKVVGDELSNTRIQRELQDADVLINATSVGMSPNAHESLVKQSWLRTDLCVMDIVYKPDKTRLIQQAKAAGARVITGIEMLLHQGAASFEIWTQCKAPLDVMRNALLKKLSNIGDPL
jgi:shikimate dehydrogenase